MKIHATYCMSPKSITDTHKWATKDQEKVEDPLRVTFSPKQTQNTTLQKTENSGNSREVPKKKKSIKYAQRYLRSMKKNRPL